MMLLVLRSKAGCLWGVGSLLGLRLLLLLLPLTVKGGRLPLAATAASYCCSCSRLLPLPASGTQHGEFGRAAWGRHAVVG